MSPAPLAVLLGLLPVVAAGAVIFGKDNDANQTDPGNGVPWRAVGRVLERGGALTSHGGCAVYIGNRFAVTADHIQLFEAMTFDGVTACVIDPAFRAVPLGNKVDLKVFRLRAEPGVPAAALLPAGEQEDFSPENRVWHVGFGVGRVPGTALDASEVTWGPSATAAKRWSVNVLRGSQPHRDTDNGSDHAYEALFTVLGHPAAAAPGLPENEGAITSMDSGSGLFQRIHGVWYLVGVATDVDRIGSGTSRFGSERLGGTDAGDRNFFVRIQPDRAELEAAMTRRQWPHIRLRYRIAAVAALLAAACGLAWRMRAGLPRRGAAPTS